ncbi:lysozyme inhibitor LprI family protein [Methylocella sp.]|uniref:lysozyme inhibitor LprI family protein n=1 Tax=Methylocella sp. TaxID=1978226 RepID=UPI0035B154B0
MPPTILGKFLTSRPCPWLDAAVALAAALALGGPARAEFASFDCAKVELDAEKTVCKVDALGARDVKMAALYQVLQGAPSAWSGMAWREFRDAQRDLQATWAAKTRDACGADVSCLEQAYDRRIEELSSTIGKSLGLTYGRMCDAP